jgi:hypothetical protein
MPDSTPPTGTATRPITIRPLARPVSDACARAALRFVWDSHAPLQITAWATIAQYATEHGVRLEPSAPERTLENVRTVLAGQA